MEFYNGIYNALANNSIVPVTAEEGMDVIKIIEAAIRSNKERRVIEIN
jgi:predicted dehydrogenase